MRLPAAVLLALAFSALRLQAQWIPNNPVTAVQKQADGVLLKQQVGSLRIQVCTDSIVHVIYSPTGSFPTRPKIIVTKTNWSPVPWNLQENDKSITISTAHLRVTVNRADALIAYDQLDGSNLITEGPKQMTPAVVNGEHTFHAEDVYKIYGSEEAIYGLGQHQAGVWNYPRRIGRSLTGKHQHRRSHVSFEQGLWHLLEQYFEQQIQ